MRKALVLLLALGLAFAFVNGLGGAGWDEIEGQVPLTTAPEHLRPEGANLPEQEPTEGSSTGESARAQVALFPAQAAESPAGLELRFRVTSIETGLPIAGALVKGGGWKARTDAEGLAVHLLDERETSQRHWAQISADGFVSKRESVPPNHPTFESQLSPGIPFDLRIVGAATGTGIDGVLVRARQFNDEDPQLSYRAQSKTSTNGEASFPPAHPGRELRLKLTRNGSLPEKASIMIHDPGPHVIEFGAGGKVHVVLLTADGAPIANTPLNLVGPHGTLHGWQLGLATDRQGQAQLAGLIFGARYYLESSGPPARSQVFVLTDESPEQWIEIRSEAEPPLLNVRVTDEQGKPWQGLVASVQRRLPADKMNWPRNFVKSQAGAASTDSDGRAKLTLALSGSMKLSLSRGTGAPVEREFNIEPGEERSIEMVYPRGVSLSGRFLDESGEPVSNIKVSYRELLGKTDEKGCFEFDGLNHEPADLLVKGREDARGETPALMTWMRYSSVVPEEERQDFRRAEPVLLTGTYAPESEVRASKWTVYFADGRSLTQNHVQSKEGRASLRVSSNAIPWVVTVGEWSERSAPRVYPNLAPKPGETVDLGDLDRLSGRTIQGIVRGLDLSPMPGVPVEIDLRGPSWDAETMTDASGAYLFENVPAAEGDLYCSVDVTDALTAFCTREFEAGSESETIGLELRAEHSVRGVLRRQDGTPLESAQVTFMSSNEDGSFGWGSGSKTRVGGSYEVGLEAGSYQVFVEPFGEDVVILGPRVEMPAAQDLELLIEVP